MWKIGCLTLLLSLPVYSQTNGKVDPPKAPPVIPKAQFETSPQDPAGSQTSPYKNWPKFTFTPGRTFNFADNKQPILNLPRSVQAPGKSKVCSIPLLQVPIPSDRNFTIRQVPPQQMDAGMVVKPTAPACDDQSSQAAGTPATPEEPKK
jgi:hypothetical protein